MPVEGGDEKSGPTTDLTPPLSSPPPHPTTTGKPESYVDYFSLNQTSAELLLLKPVDRELHSRFDLVIKVKWGAVGMMEGLQHIHHVESAKYTIKSEYFSPGVLMRFFLIKRRLP